MASSSIRTNRVRALVAACACTLAGCGNGAPPPDEGSGGGGRGAASGAGGTGGSVAGAAGTGQGVGGTGSAGAGAGGTVAGGGVGSAGAGAGGSAGISGSAPVGGAGLGGAAASAGAPGSGAAGEAGSAGAGGGNAGGGAGGSSAGGAGENGGGSGGAQGGAGAGGAGAGGAGGAGGAAFAPCPATGPCRIMPFGDSITEGYPVYGGYRIELFHLARQANHAVTFVGSAVNGPMTVDGVAFPRNHEGHGGYTIENEPARGTNGIAPLVMSSMTSYAPHIVTLMIGTNDINGNIDVADAPNRLGKLLDSIYAVNPDVLVVLAQIVPTRNDGTNQAVRTYNAAIPALVSARVAAGRHLVLIDMYDAFARDDDYKTALLGDNLHPNQAGYARMAETWYAVLAPYLR